MHRTHSPVGLLLSAPPSAIRKSQKWVTPVTPVELLLTAPPSGADPQVQTKQSRKFSKRIFGSLFQIFGKQNDYRYGHRVFHVGCRLG